MWKVVSRVRLSGATAGSEYKEYVDPNGKRYRSMKAAEAAGYKPDAGNASEPRPQPEPQALPQLGPQPSPQPQPKPGPEPQPGPPAEPPQAPQPQQQPSADETDEETGAPQKTDECFICGVRRPEAPNPYWSGRHTAGGGRSARGGQCNVCRRLRQDAGLDVKSLRKDKPKRAEMARKSQAIQLRKNLASMRAADARKAEAAKAAARKRKPKSAESLAEQPGPRRLRKANTI